MILSQRNINYQYHKGNRYEVAQNARFLVILINQQDEDNAWLVIHSLEENRLVGKREDQHQHCVAIQVNYCDWWESIMIKEINLNELLIDLQGENYLDSGECQYIHRFYCFNSIRKELRIIHEIISESILGIHFPLIYENSFQKTLVIHDFSDIHNIKIRQFYDFCSREHISYQEVQIVRISTKHQELAFLVPSLEAIDLNKTFAAKFERPILFFLRQFGDTSLKMYMTFEAQLTVRTIIGEKLLGSPKQIFFNHDKLFIIRRYPKLVRSLQTGRNFRLQNSRFILQYGNSKDADSIYDMTSGRQVTIFSEHSQLMICRKDIILRFLQTEVVILKIQTN